MPSREGLLGQPIYQHRLCCVLPDGTQYHLENQLPGALILVIAPASSADYTPDPLSALDHNGLCQFKPENPSHVAAASDWDN